MLSMFTSFFNLIYFPIKSNLILLQQLKLFHKNRMSHYDIIEPHNFSDGPYDE